MIDNKIQSAKILYTEQMNNLLHFHQNISETATESNKVIQ